MATEKKEILFEMFDSGWGKAMPTSLLTYADGEMDLHRQTGPSFNEALEKARKELAQQGLVVGKVEFIGPTGAYVRVTRAADVQVTTEPERSFA